MLMFRTMDLMTACLMTYQTDVTKNIEEKEEMSGKLDKLKQEHAGHMRHCPNRTERFNSEKEVLQRQVKELSQTPENRARISEAASSLTQAITQNRIIKSAIE